MLARVVGKHCESGDIVVKDEFLPGDVAPGDLLAVPGTGAYCRSLSSQYNHMPRPPVVAVRDGEARVIVRRETIEDLLALDVVTGRWRRQSAWRRRWSGSRNNGRPARGHGQDGTDSGAGPVEQRA